MKPLAGLAAIVTGAGSGLGRSHALHLASLGAAVVVNDVGRAGTGWRADDVAGEITARGGRAVSDHGDISSWTHASDLVDTCVDAFGRLDILVNNAGIVRDRTMARMAESEWDDVVRVNLKGHAAPAVHAMAHWRKQAKRTGAPAPGAIVHTSSIGGLMANFGQGNYTATKLGIVALSAVLALEGAQLGVRSNVIAPSARTETTLKAMPSAKQFPPMGGDDSDFWDPANVSPVVGWLASPRCRVTGQVFHVVGNEVRLFAPPTVLKRFTTNGRWTADDLERQIGPELTRWPTAMDFLDTVEKEARADG
ncbi:SDR family NAD(P)-dependent oxidoreductase [Amycolatopsis viridis]|uniref:NAD(P)-dependent dehydrogenase (Short-subunit alcohol dehydrogenase family) n=1 Tax=Amycolatopsis viridis TaxID=185678 RepID=A0ABX0SNC8_9PSEU|nr:SDR family NAD(P)-dependent oxidoreductase [Amycolatopsis viridis]NIH78484.1 NAD(P)-dependent dehydrogenase (short-subunit alcohol dehydrogenase family) [Amycolatopsis viridis]